jgi:Flp pilus assembly protein TadD
MARCTGCRRALELSPNDANAHASFALWLLCQGRTEEAVSWAQRGRQLDPLAVSGVSVAWILYQSHRYEEALREVHSVLAVQPDEVTALTTLGFILSTNGHAAEAIPGLEKAYVERSNILQFLQVHPYFDPIRSDPRCTRLVRRVWSETN